jgi:hypothetical protein
VILLDFVFTELDCTLTLNLLRALLAILWIIMDQSTVAHFVVGWFWINRKMFYQFRDGTVKFK